jgi:hypothetical protein
MFWSISLWRECAINMKKALNPKNNVACSCYDMKLMLCEKMVLGVYVENKTIMNLLP